MTNSRKAQSEKLATGGGRETKARTTNGTTASSASWQAHQASLLHYYTTFFVLYHIT